MVYFLNTNISARQKVFIALTKVHGLGTYQCIQICDELGISSDKRIKQLSTLDLEKLETLITQNYEIASDVKRHVLLNIQRLIKIGTYRGFRHSDGLPVRGQKTHGNSQTVRKLQSTHVK